MATSGGNQAREKLRQLIRQPGGTFTQNEDNTYSASIKYVCAWNELIKLMPRRGKGTHPDFPTLVCNGVSAMRKAPGVAEIAATYKGTIRTGTPPTPNVDAVAVEELSRSVSQEPIQTHPDFEELLGGTPDDVKNGAKFDPETDIFEGFGPGSRFIGVTSYLSPGATYRRSYEVATKPTSINVGEVVTPTGAPSIPAGYQWLAMGQSWTKSGDIYSVTEEYGMSARNGWDPLIYAS